MTKLDKLIEKLLSNSKDFEWRELVKILAFYGFELINQGQTGGSRRCFENKDGIKLHFHEPHPNKIVKSYVIRQVIEILKKEGLL